ncbi:MAG: hypothetical protein U0165_11250 [Polyangiaceae bacterium]
MSKHPIPRLVWALQMVIALVFVLMTPSVARADGIEMTALCGLCGASRVDVSELADLSDFCEARANAETNTVELAGLCDPRGASDIAPIQLIRLGDATIDGLMAASFTTSPRGYAAIEGRSMPAVPDAGAYDLPVLPQHASMVVPRSYETSEVSWLSSDAGPRSGWARAVDHPPRA